MKKISINSNQVFAEKLLSAYLISILKSNELPVIICIGSDRVTGDCLGPLTGHFLVTKHNTPAFVYGTLEKTVTAANLVETLDFVAKTHPRKKIVVVDASIGGKENVGFITAAKGGILPGSGCGKVLPKTGDFSITAVVTHSSQNAHTMLQNTRLNFVYSLSELIAASLDKAIRFQCSLTALSSVV